MLTRVAMCCLLTWCVFFAPAKAAESYDNCTAFITQLPISVNLPGVYCLKGNLAVPAVTVPDGQTHVAVDIRTDRVTLDCKSFGIDGRPNAVADSFAIAMGKRRDVHVRNCTLTAFTAGILLTESHGNNVVEDNRLVGMRNQAISVYGDGSVVRRNIILDTVDPRPAGSGTSSTAISVVGSVDVTDNLIAGVSANGPVLGITTNGSSGTIARNRIRDLDDHHARLVLGILVAGPLEPGKNGPIEPRVTIRDNDLGINVYSEGSRGIDCFAQASLVSGNVLKGFQSPILSCARVTGNDISSPVPY